MYTKEPDTLFLVGYSIFIGLVCIGLAFLFALVFINFLMGCGEIFYFNDGTWATGECFIIPHEVTRGTW